MPVAVPIYERFSSHRVVKSYSNFRAVCQPLTPETSKYVIQSGCQPVAHQAGFSHHSRFQETLPSHISFIPSYSGEIVSRTGFACEKPEAGHGSIAAGDAVISKQNHAEACHSPVLPLSSHPPPIGPQQFTQRREVGDTQTGRELETSVSAVEVDTQSSGPSAIFSSSGGGMIWYGPPKQPIDSAVEGELCDTLLQSAVTPFADFVDRIVATEVNHAGDRAVGDAAVSYPPVGTPGRQLQAAPAEPLSNPSYIRAYRTLAEPLSEWMADYVWKICTDGVGLPRRFVGIGPSRRYERKPSSSLAKSIHSVLCSTLLQPSAIILALWYITRLPVIFEGQSLGVNLTPSELEFRKELYGEGVLLSPPGDRSRLEACAPFRIALLGCMLANKWLDDHTFSNKTWQSISDVPIQSINRLELAALAVLGHDLSVTPKAWELWLAQLQRFPLPICRPSMNDSYAIARKMIMDLTQLHDHSGLNGSPMNPAQPVFSTLLLFDFNKNGDQYQDGIFDPFEIDLDEDGPLREEYVPKRRSSALKVDAHKRSTSVGSSQWGIHPDRSMCCDTRRLDAGSIAAMPARDVTLGRSFPYMDPNMTSWDVMAGLSYNSSATFLQVPHQPSIRSSQSSNGFSSSCVYPIPPICPPSMTSSASPGPSAQSIGHMRSLSQSFVGGNDVYGLPFASCARYVGHASTFFSGQSDACHFRPLWLKA